MASASSQLRTPLAERLATRIRGCGRITFADYMAECLYHPEWGYYSRAEAKRFADYYTSVDVHRIFGRLLARQFAEMWDLLGRPPRFDLVEGGAGAGRLASHILDFAARTLPVFYAALHYTAVESSPGRRAQHAQQLAAHITAGRVTSAAGFPAHIAEGCIFSNELLDALPVHRVLGSANGALREICVGLDADRFVDVVAPLSTPAIADYFSAQSVTLAVGQHAEAALISADWLEAAARRLGRGFVLTIDYGHEARELYNDRHLRGTLLAYRTHRASEDFYAAPGEQDLTAHVSFTALDLAGQRAGLERTGLVSQSHFLMALGRGNEFADLYNDGQPETDCLRARLLLKNLIYPEGMGEIFSVFIQHKGVAAPRLTGLQPL
jgi:SAM-dependent MidA family methyltransferase